MSSLWFCDVCKKEMSVVGSSSFDIFQANLYLRVCVRCHEDLCAFVKCEYARLKEIEDWHPASVTSGQNSLCDICGATAPMLSDVDTGILTSIDVCKKHAKIIATNVKQKFLKQVPLSQSLRQWWKI